MNKYDELINRYEAGSESVQQAFQAVPQERLDRNPAPGKWSPRQILVHLADAELVLAHRIRIVAAAPNLPLQAFDQDRWAAALSYQTQSADDAVALFCAIRTSTTNMLRALPALAFENIGLHEERGPLTLAALVEGAISHSNSHARQITEASGKTQVP